MFRARFTIALLHCNARKANSTVKVARSETCKLSFHYTDLYKTIVCICVSCLLIVTV